MKYNDKIVISVERLSKTIKTYQDIVGHKIANEQDLLERESKHSFVHDQFKSALSEIEDFQPVDSNDKRKEVLLEHFSKIVEQHKKVIAVFGDEYSLELHKNYNLETERLNNLLDELKQDISKKTNK